MPASDGTGRPRHEVVMSIKDPLELIDGHPFAHLVTTDERSRIDALVAQLLDDAANTNDDRYSGAISGGDGADQ